MVQTCPITDFHSAFLPKHIIPHHRNPFDRTFIHCTKQIRTHRKPNKQKITKQEACKNVPIASIHNRKIERKQKLFHETDLCVCMRAYASCFFVVH